jgi:methyl-accepting chemotaxis protein
MAGSVNRRKKLLIDSSQRQLLGVYFVHFMVVLVIFFAAMVFIFNQQIIRSGLSVAQKQEFASLMSSFAHRMWPTMWIVFVLMVLHILYVTHKIAGPLYRIRSVLSYVGSGNLTARARLRRGDYLTKDADAVNAMAGELDDKIGRMRDEWEAASKSLEELGRSVEGASRSEAKQHLEQLRAHMVTWKESLDEFETSERKPPIQADQFIRNSKGKLDPAGADKTENAAETHPVTPPEPATPYRSPSRRPTL